MSRWSPKLVDSMVVWRVEGIFAQLIRNQNPEWQVRILSVSASRDPLRPIGSSMVGGVDGSVSLAIWEGWNV